MATETRDLNAKELPVARQNCGCGCGVGCGCGCGCCGEQARTDEPGRGATSQYTGN